MPMSTDSQERRDGGEEYPGARWLAGGSPSDVLARLLVAKELELGARVAARLESRAVLLDPDRTYLRSLAHTARKAMFYRGVPPLAEFLDACIDRGIDDLVDEDVESERSGAPLEPADARFRAVSETLGVESTTARRICVVLNTQHDELRHATYAVLVLRKSVDAHATAARRPVPRVREPEREGLRRLSSAFGRRIGPTEYGL